MTGDALSDVLKSVRLTGAIFFDVAARAPWVAEQPPRRLILDRIRPDADHLIAFHLVTEGRMFANVIGGPSVALEAGEVILFAHGDTHVISSAPGMRADAVARAASVDAAKGTLPCFVGFGDEARGGQPVKLFCGFLACDSGPFNPLLENLPRILRAGGPGQGATGRLGHLIRFALDETNAGRPGTEAVLARLSELVFIEVVRQYVEGLAADRAGWLSGLRDPFVGKALARLHAEPARDWTLDILARETAQSRSALAERFAQLVGMPPMQYLARWRMQLASAMLADDANLAAVAAEVGYGSEAAFSRAFKKIVGVSPSVWRLRQPRHPARAAADRAA